MQKDRNTRPSETSSLSVGGTVGGLDNIVMNELKATAPDSYLLWLAAMQRGYCSLPTLHADTICRPVHLKPFDAFNNEENGSCRKESKDKFTKDALSKIKHDKALE